MQAIFNQVINFVKLRQRHFCICACCSGSLYLLTVFVPQEIPTQSSLVRPAALLVFTVTGAAVVFGWAEGAWSAARRNLLVPFANWTSANIKSSKLKKELLGLELDDVLELARARGYGIRDLHLNSDSSMARRLLTKGIIVRRHQKLGYDPGFQIDDLAWALVQDMQEFHVKNTHWLEGIINGRISLEAAKENSDKMLPELHPTVKALLLRSKE